MKPRWTCTIFDRPANVRRLMLFFFLVLVGLLAVDGFIHKHEHFEWANSPVFFAAFGFVACVVVVFGAKGLRWLMRRPEDYYEADRHGQAPEEGSDR